MKFESSRFLCPGCGSAMCFSREKGGLYCAYCKRSVAIDGDDETLGGKKDLLAVLNSGDDISPKKVERSTDCPKCGASFDFADFRFSSRCPYCETPAITDCNNPLKPDSVLPFAVNQKQAHENFAKWIGSLWFAPSELKHLVDTRKELTGYYLPYWFFDADSSSYYTGERGDAYYVTVERTRVVDGRETVVQEQERRIRWTPVSGELSRSFSDLAINADTTLPVNLLRSINRWSMSEARNFSKEYLSCFESQEYTVNLGTGYGKAESIMNDIIYGDVISDIGGDEQRVHNIDSTFSNRMYRYSLLPVWSTHFRYKGKEYHYVINGQNGLVAGSRPYSYAKIFMLVLAVIIFIMLMVYWQDIAAMFGSTPSQPQ